MPSRKLIRVVLRYTVLGGGAGAVLVGITAVATSFPLRLLAMIMVGIAGLVAPLLVAADTGVDSIDEGAEAGFVGGDSAPPASGGVSFPGGLQLALALFGFGIVGVVTMLALA